MQNTHLLSIALGFSFSLPLWSWALVKFSSFLIPYLNDPPTEPSAGMAVGLTEVLVSKSESKGIPLLPDLLSPTSVLSTLGQENQSGTDSWLCFLIATPNGLSEGTDVSSLVSRVCYILSVVTVNDLFQMSTIIHCKKCLTGPLLSTDFNVT